MQLTRPVTPWWFWVVGVLFVLWNAGGAYDYLMTHTGNEAYLAAAEARTPGIVARLEALPAWRIALWAAAVWGGVLGALLLVLRRGLAVPVYLVSLAALGLGLLADLTALGMADAYRGQVPMTAAIFVLAIFQLWFARFARRAGFLR